MKKVSTVAALIEECAWKGGDSGNSAGQKTYVQRKNNSTHLTPTGLLMEGVYTSLRRLFAENQGQ